ncbi:glycosyltransferase family 4 protein [Phenylobacterium sp. LjRoot219]|uniref:glycosyltransferase family 4 protein n=1 Tax=Phenylobacterium sp. LjRoot219 TaxID=3342283 RepID=UPI003ECD773E
MQPGAERPIRVRFVYTPYRHFGEHSGYPCFVQHLDPRRFRTERHGAADSHEEVPLGLRPLRPWLRATLKRRPMQWYKVSDLNAELAAFGRCLAQRLDLVHFLDGEHSAQFLPRLLDAVGSKVLTVASFHQPPELLEELLDPSVLSGFDHIVLMSPSQRRFFQGRLPDDRISVILHGVDTDFFHPDSQASDRPTFRCITAGHWLRDWDVVRSVAERMPAVEFHVVTARETGIEGLPNVVRHRGVDDETLASLYRAADVLFLPLLDSTANNSLLEGVASGLPTITTALDAVRAYLPGQEAILTPPGDADAALAALKRLQDDPALRRRMGALARARAEALSWRLVAAQHDALFTSLLQHARAPNA